jgi:hypothetical protein
MAATNWKQGDRAFHLGVDITAAAPVYMVGALDSLIEALEHGWKRSGRTRRFGHITCFMRGHVRDISGVRANESA